MLVRGAWPTGNLDHTCHKPECVNPEHLRNCTQTENCRNRRPRKQKSSRFKGVCWNKGAGKWHAQIRINKRSKHLGHFNNEEDAATAYDEAAEKCFEQFALTNKKLGLL